MYERMLEGGIYRMQNEVVGTSIYMLIRLLEEIEYSESPIRRWLHAVSLFLLIRQQSKRYNWEQIYFALASIHLPYHQA